MWPLKKTTSESAFWKWFQQNETRIFHFERDKEQVFNEFSEAMHKVDPDLTFEFGPEVQDKREFIISANGVQSAFPAVYRLVQHAPPLKRWTLTQFRPRRPADDPFVIEMNGLRISSKDVRVQFSQTGGLVSIRFLMPNYSSEEHERYGSVGFIMLDTILGEYDVTTKIEGITFESLNVEHDETMFTLEEFPLHFDSCIASLAQRD